MKIPDLFDRHVLHKPRKLGQILAVVRNGVRRKILFNLQVGYKFIDVTVHQEPRWRPDGSPFLRAGSLLRKLAVRERAFRIIAATVKCLPSTGAPLDQLPGTPLDRARDAGSKGLGILAFRESGTA